MNGLKNLIARWSVNRLARRQPIKSIESDTFWQDIRHVLIGLPPTESQCMAVEKWVKPLHQQVPGITFWYRGDQPEMVKALFTGSRVVYKSDLVYKWSRLPDPASIQSRIPEPINLVLDLDMDFHMESVYIWLNKKPEYRLKMGVPGSDSYYNLIFKNKAGSNYDQSLNELFRFLNAMR